MEERRSYDMQVGNLTVSVGALKESFEDFRNEQREYNAAIIDRLDTKINGKIENQGSVITQHGIAIATLIAEMKSIRETPMQLPMPSPGTKTTVEVSESESKPLTRGDLKIVVATLLAGGTILGLIFKYGPALLKALEVGAQ